MVVGVVVGRYDGDLCLEMEAGAVRFVVAGDLAGCLRRYEYAEGEQRRGEERRGEENDRYVCVTYTW